MIVLILGCPGCGKTTQGERLFARFGLPQIVAAEAVREGVADGDLAPGAGGEVSDDVIAQYIVQRASSEQCIDGFSLEGYPNTTRQWEALRRAFAKNKLKINAALHLDVGNEEWGVFMQPLLDALDQAKLLFSIEGRAPSDEVEEQVFACLTANEPQPEEESEAQAPEGIPEMTGELEDPDSIEAQVKKVKWIDPRISGDFRFGTKMPLTATTKYSRVYGSNNRYREDLNRHERLKHDPFVKYPVAVTASMEYGWDSKNPALYQKDPEMFHPRMKSRETMYAEALILGPRHP